MKSSRDERDSPGRVHSGLSARIVEYLRMRGNTQKQIGHMLGVKESFISRVARGERSLTLKHLCRLEAVLNTPIAILLLDAERAIVPEKTQPMYDEAIRLLRGSSEIRKRLATEILVDSTSDSQQTGELSDELLGAALEDPNRLDDVYRCALTYLSCIGKRLGADADKDCFPHSRMLAIAENPRRIVFSRRFIEIDGQVTCHHEDLLEGLESYAHPARLLKARLRQVYLRSIKLCRPRSKTSENSND